MPRTALILMTFRSPEDSPSNRMSVLPPTETITTDLASLMIPRTCTPASGGGGAAPGAPGAPGAGEADGGGTGKGGGGSGVEGGAAPGLGPAGAAVASLITGTKGSGLPVGVAGTTPEGAGAGAGCASAGGAGAGAGVAPGGVVGAGVAAGGGVTGATAAGPPPRSLVPTQNPRITATPMATINTMRRFCCRNARSLSNYRAPLGSTYVSAVSPTFSFGSVEGPTDIVLTASSRGKSCSAVINSTNCLNVAVIPSWIGIVE